MDEDAIGRLPLTAVAGHGVAVVKMRVLPEVEVDRAPRVEPNPQIASRVDLLHDAGLPVGDVTLPQRRSELNAIAGGEFAFFPAIDVHTPEP